MRYQTLHTLKQNIPAAISLKMGLFSLAFLLTAEQYLQSVVRLSWDSRLTEGNSEVCDFRPGGVLRA